MITCKEYEACGDAYGDGDGDGDGDGEVDDAMQSKRGKVMIILRNEFIFFSTP